jgi:hypothetical protein
MVDVRVEEILTPEAPAFVAGPQTRFPTLPAFELID